MHPRASLLAVVALFVAAPCTAQAIASVAWGAGPVERADALYFAGQPEQAFEELRAFLESRPDDYEALWRIARATLVLGVAAEGWRAQNSWFDTGMAFGDRAVAVRPDGIDGLYWRGAVTGRRALNASAEYGAELAQIAYEDAHAILAMDPQHGGAHNILGKLFFEIMSLSRIERWVGRTFVRTDALRESSWEGAELHLLAAVEAWPDWVVFEYDLAELYRKRGRKDEARAAYDRVTHMASVHPSDPAVKDAAARALEDLGS